jgi:hypothetical protein
MEKDVETLSEIAGNTTAIKYFNYNGEKRKVSDAEVLRTSLVEEYNALFDIIAEKDRAVYLHFFELAAKTGDELVLMSRYEKCYKIAEMYNAQREQYVDIFKVAGELYHIGPEDIHADNPQDLSAQFAAFAAIYRETENMISSLHNTSKYNLPEATVQLAQQLPGINTTAVTSAAINQLHDVSVTLYNWVHNAISQVKKDLLVHQLGYLPHKN